MQASTPWDDVAFSSSERDRHLGRRPISQLNTWPVVSPVNASRRPSRDVAHHSGSGRLAIPYPVKDSHLLFFVSFAWRTPSRIEAKRYTSRIPACDRNTADRAFCERDLLRAVNPPPMEGAAQGS